MYCSNCGKKIDSGNTFCTGCGFKLGNIGNMNNRVKSQEEVSGLKIASIILGVLGIIGSLTWIFSPISIIIALVGLILGIVATKKVKNAVGIILSSVGLGLSLIMILLLVLVFRSTFDIISGYEEESYYDDYYNNYYEKFKDVIDKY